MIPPGLPALRRDLNSVYHFNIFIAALPRISLCLSNENKKRLSVDMFALLIYCRIFVFIFLLLPRTSFHCSCPERLLKPAFYDPRNIKIASVGYVHLMRTNVGHKFLTGRKQCVPKNPSLRLASPRKFHPLIQNMLIIHLECMLFVCSQRLPPSGSLFFYMICNQNKLRRACN